MKIILVFFVSAAFFFASGTYNCCFAESKFTEAAKSQVLIKQNIYFDLNTSSLTDAAIIGLNEIAALLRLYPKNLLVIEGHADNSGEKKYNQKLSNARAKAVFDFFVENGINKNRMKIVHYGDKKPLKDNTTEFGRGKNRRAEIIVFKND